MVMKFLEDTDLNIKCSSITSKNIQCKNNGKFSYKDKIYCKIHFENMTLIITDDPKLKGKIFSFLKKNPKISLQDLESQLKKEKEEDEKKEKLKEGLTFSEFTGKLLNELSKHQLLRYIPHAARDVADYVARSKEHQSAMTSAAQAGSHVAAKDAADKSRASMGKAFKRLGGIDRATRTLARKEIKKEEVEQIEEATVATRKYDWGTMKTVHHGAMFSIPLHPEHHEPIAKLKHGESHSFKDETGRKWKATREHDTVHFHGGSYGTQKTSVPHKSLQESRGHKTLATFFKNREVAQRAFTGQNKPAETPKEPEKKEVKKESVNPALMAILKKRQAAYDAKKKKEEPKKVAESKTPAVHAADLPARDGDVVQRPAGGAAVPRDHRAQGRQGLRRRQLPRAVRVDRATAAHRSRSSSRGSSSSGSPSCARSL